VLDPLLRAIVKGAGAAVVVVVVVVGAAVVVVVVVVVVGAAVVVVVVVVTETAADTLTLELYTPIPALSAVIVITSPATTVKVRVAELL
jgi:hypothetical protein